MAFDMKLYKYRSLSNLWHTLDIIINKRLFCAHWLTLNDPLEGRYEIYLGDKGQRDEALMLDRIERARDSYRIASLSATATNFLLWSHYADGHKGVVVEMEIPSDHPSMTEVFYSPFSSVFSNAGQIEEDMMHLFNGKSKEWEYEKEYRIITDCNYFYLPSKPSRLLLGPMISDLRRATEEIAFRFHRNSRDEARSDAGHADCSRTEHVIAIT
jgi:hypothetical protein